MDVQIYFSYSFVSTESKMYKVNDNLNPPQIDDTTETTAKALIDQGWRLAHAIKTSQSAQLESFNFLLIFEK